MSELNSAVVDAGAPYISLVIPVFNEEQSLPLLYESILKLSDFGWEAIIIDDGSNDGSARVAREIAGRDRRVRLITLRRNYGQTAAMMAGFDNARGEIVVPLDADLQNDPADIPKLLERIDQGFDVVSGWRQNRWKEKWLTRRLPSAIANFLISKTTGTVLHDYGCSLKAYRRDILRDVKIYGEMHRFIPAFAAWQGARVSEVVVSDHPRKFGSTKYGVDRAFRVLLDLLTVKFLIGYSTKPMHFFGRVCFWSLMVSVASGLLAVYWKLTGQKDFIATPLPLFAALFMIIGVQFLLMGLVAEMMTRNYYETVGRPIYNIKEKINF